MTNVPSHSIGEIDVASENSTAYVRPIAPLRFYTVVFAPFALSHFVSYVLRSVNAVLYPVLGSAFSLDVVQFGILTSAYFFAFAIAQLPVGIALDRYGPRRVQCILLPLAAIGCVWFALARSLPELITARALTGCGLAACFMGSLKAASDWLPASRMPSISGYLLAIGGLGAMASTAPAQIVIAAIGWRGLLVALGALIVLSATAIGFVTPEPAREAQRNRAPVSLRPLAAVFRSAAFRRTVSVALAPHAAFFAVQGLWLGPWLRQVAHLDEQATGVYLLAGMTAMVFGTLFAGKFSEWASARGVKPLDVAACGLWVFVLVQLAMISCSRSVALPVAIGFPLFGSFAGLEFAIVTQSVPRALAARASTCLNLLVFCFSFVLQAGFGAILGLWPKSAGGIYPNAAYQTAFGAFLALQLPGLIAWLFGVVRNFRISRKIG